MARKYHLIELISEQVKTMEMIGVRPHKLYIPNVYVQKGNKRMQNTSGYWLFISFKGF